MTIERKPVAFDDLRGWMRALAAAGELHEIDAQVYWKCGGDPRRAGRPRQMRTFNPSYISGQI
jgi:hypothetical protein